MATIRDAVLTDLDLLVAFTLEEAREAEGLELDAVGVRRGPCRIPRGSLPW